MKYLRQSTATTAVDTDVFDLSTAPARTEPTPAGSAVPAKPAP